MRGPTAKPQIVADQDDIEDTTLRDLYRVWDETRGNLPGPPEIDIIAVPAAVPLIATARIEGEESLVNASINFVGSEIVGTAGVDLTGKRISELRNFPNMYLLAVRCLETRKAVKLGPTKVANKRNEFMDIELIMLPLFDESMMLCGLVYGVAYLR